MNTNDTHKQTLNSVIKLLSTGLVHAHTCDGFGLVATPILYRTGVSVVLRITNENGLIKVSDDGRAYMEAYKYGASDSFERIARRHVDEKIRFSNGQVFCVCGIDEAVWASVVVANQSARFLDDVLSNREIKKKSEFVSILREKLIMAFGPKNVEKSEPIVGASGEFRHPDYKLSYGRHIGYLKLVKPSRRSVESAVTMYHDLMLMPKAPSMISAVEDINEFGPKLKLLASWSQIIDKGTRPEAIPELIMASGPMTFS